MKQLALQPDVRVRAVVLCAADSTEGNSLQVLVQLNQDEPGLEAFVEDVFRGEGTGNSRHA